VAHGVPPPRAAPALLRRVVLSRRNKYPLEKLWSWRVSMFLFLIVSLTHVCEALLVVGRYARLKIHMRCRILLDCLHILLLVAWPTLDNSVDTICEYVIFRVLAES
jgi:hypothetical protein